MTQDFAIAWEHARFCQGAFRPARMQTAVSSGCAVIEALGTAKPALSMDQTSPAQSADLPMKWRFGMRKATAFQVNDLHLPVGKFIRHRMRVEIGVRVDLGSALNHRDIHAASRQMRG